MVARAATAVRPIRTTRGTLQREQVFWAYIFLLPWIVGLVVFIVGPILFSLGLSFFMGQNFNGTLETLKPIQQQVDGC